jgi:hypothetical protein
MEIEDRDAIFRRAFLKTLRLLNENYGPIMNDWKWGIANPGLFNIPLLKTSLFSAKKSNTESDNKIGGITPVISLGTINAINIPGANNVLSLSGVFHANLLYISPAFSCPMDPDSEYYTNYTKVKKYLCLNREKGVHTQKIIPQSKKFGM